VGERFVDEGSLLSVNAPVITIIGIDKVIVRTSIIERDYGRISVGQQANVAVDAFPSNLFHGKVTRIAPVLQESSRMAQMEIEVVNDSLILKPGMFARVHVVLIEKDSVQIVSSRAVVSREGQKVVFTIDEVNKTAIYTPVNVGIVTFDKTEIVSPSLSGRVVTLGQHLLADGNPVILPESGGTGAMEDQRDRRP
jgi:RND family efflux transporter MFP subunit